MNIVLRGKDQNCTSISSSPLTRFVLVFPFWEADPEQSISHQYSLSSFENISHQHNNGCIS